MFFKLIIIVYLLRFFSVFADTFYILPDRFEIQTIAGNPMFSVVAMDGGYKANMIFKASYQDTEYMLYQQYADKIDQLQIVELPTEPETFRFLSKAIENRVVVKDIKKEYFSNLIKVEITASSSMTQSDFLQLLRFNIVYGTTQGKITCTSSTYHRYCNQTLKNVPVTNQFRMGHSSDYQQYLSPFLTLNQYKNQAFLGHALSVFSKRDIDQFATQDLFSNGACLNIDQYKRSICDLILKYSPTKSLIQAIEVTGKTLFVDSGLSNQDISNAVLGLNDIQIITVDEKYFQVEFGRFAEELNKNIELQFGLDQGLNIPFISLQDYRNTMRTHFASNSFYWENQMIKTRKEWNLKGTVELGPVTLKTASL
jgi:hypothetical protein